MKNLRTKIYMYGRILTFVLFILTFVSCGKETLDFINPYVDLFVKQLKYGNYSAEGAVGLSKFPSFS